MQPKKVIKTAESNEYADVPIDWPKLFPEKTSAHDYRAIGGPTSPLFWEYVAAFGKMTTADLLENGWRLDNAPPEVVREIGEGSMFSHGANSDWHGVPSNIITKEVIKKHGSRISPRKTLALMDKYSDQFDKDVINQLYKVWDSKIYKERDWREELTEKRPDLKEYLNSLPRTGMQASRPTFSNYKYHIIKTAKNRYTLIF